MSFLLGPQLPWLLLAFLLLVGGAGAGGYIQGREDGRAALEAEQAREAATIRAAQNAALAVAADKILQFDFKSTTIRQKTEVITREVPVYRDCKHDAAAFGLLNDALAPGVGLSPAGTDQGKLPGSDPAR